MAKISLYKIISEVMDEGKYHLSERTLLRRFQKLVAIGGGIADTMKTGTTTYFEEEEVLFVKHILKDLAMNKGLCSQFIDKNRGDDYVGASQVHEFIQKFFYELEADGASEEECQANLNFLAMIFLIPVHEMRENCHRLIDGIWLNLSSYPYTHQAMMMERLTKILKKEFAEITVQSTFMVGELAELIQKSKELCGDNIGMQDYGDDSIGVEYAERDMRTLRQIQADPDLRAYVEKKLGAKAEDVFNVAYSKQK